MKNLCAGLALLWALASCSQTWQSGAGTASVRLTFATGQGTTNARSLSISGDFTKVVYRAVNLGSGAVEAEGPITGDTASVELHLHPGDTYRIEIDAVPKAGGAGAEGGVYRFGDEALVTVPTDGSFTAVRLWAQPTRSLVFRNDSSADQIAYDPKTGFTDYYSSRDSSGSQADQTFYGPTGMPFYFQAYSQTLFGMYIDGTSAYDRVQYSLDASSLVEQGTALADLNLSGSTIRAVCPDLSLEDTFYLLCRVNNSAADTDQWYVFRATRELDGEVSDWLIIGAANIQGALTGVSYPTSIAADPFTQRVFVGSLAIAYDAQEQRHYRSQIHAFGPVIGNSTAPRAAAVVRRTEVYDDDSASQFSVVRDLRVFGGDLWVLGGLGYFGVDGVEVGSSGVGRADLFRLDTQTLNPVDPVPTPLHHDISELPGIFPAGQLTNPTRFSTGWTGGRWTVLQNNPANGYYPSLWTVDPAAGTVTQVAENSGVES